MQTSAVLELSLEPNDTRRLATLCGQLDQNLKQIERRLGVYLRNRGNLFSIEGTEYDIRIAQSVLQNLYHQTEYEVDLSPDEIHLHLQSCSVLEPTTDSDSTSEKTSSSSMASFGGMSIRTKKDTVKPRGQNQTAYVKKIREHDINFGIGPAGTGKTYLAVACAVEALLAQKVERILLVRPAVEAGEKLGFLPGDLAQKVDPYLRPLYDALYEMLGFEYVGKLMEKHQIEVAPLAFMRGRTLNHAFVILDESQNTTQEQMKMFLTRIGFGSTAVITGDTTQIDLPSHQPCGLLHARKVLSKVEGMSFTDFDSKDVVRHPIVQRIVKAYELSEK